MYTREFQSFHPLTAAHPFRIWGALLSACMDWFRKTCDLLHRITVKSRKAHILREWLLYTSFREAKVYSLSISSHRSAFRASCTNLCLVGQVLAIPSTVSRATMFSRQVSWWVSSFLLQLLPYYTRLHSGNLTTNCVAACCFLYLTSWLNALWLLPHGYLFREADIAPPSL